MNKEKSNMICKKTGKQMVAVRSEDLQEMYLGMQLLYKMLESLITLWMKEEKLKQHHRPYLEVRREMGRLCDSYLNNMEVIKPLITEPIHGCGMECFGIPNGAQDMDEMLIRWERYAAGTKRPV